MDESYNPYEGTQSKVANYVPEPAENRSVMEILAHLSQSNPAAYEEAIEKLIAEKGEEWFKNLRYDWSINGRPKQFPPQPMSKWRAWVCLAGRGWGKALALDTPIPSPDGWTTMGQLRVGDKLFDENGDICSVTFVTDIQHNRDCYEVVLSDGTKIIADAEHQWQTTTRNERRKENLVGSVRNTLQILNTLTIGSNKESNHAIRLCEPVKYKNQNLNIEPYVLGAWLGDGSSYCGTLLTSNDEEIPNRIRQFGYNVTKMKAPYMWSVTSTMEVGRTASGTFSSNSGSLHSKLKEAGLLKNKHIPIKYLQSSIEQRMELLKGLMDTDGTIEKSGRCCFDNKNEKLIDEVYELLMSLGIKTVKSSKVINGTTYFRLSFTPIIPVFHLKRKLERQKLENSRKTQNYRYIKEINKIESVPVKCIQVDSPNSLFLCSRSFVTTHNTKTGGNTVDIWVNTHKKGTPPIRIALVGATTSDVNNVMVGGDSGIMSNYPSDRAPEWHTTNRKVFWKYPDGEVKAIAELFSAEEPDRLRGPQFHYAWCDELAAWRYQEAWDMLMFGLRLGDNPQVVVTTTPRPYPILLDLLKLKTTWTTIGSTYENRSNLAPAFFTEIITKYEGSTLGRQELMAEIIEEVPNAMWNYKNLDANRISYDQMDKLPEFLSVILAIDPATSTRTSSAETGMCVAAYGEDDHFYILHLDSVKMSPEKWARRAIRLFEQYNCDKMIAEVNNGGDLVDAVIKSVNPLQKVYAVHASRGKTTRAEPIAALYEQNRVHHIGRFVRGEEQMCVVGDTNVSAYSAKQISSRKFTGKLITVKTIDSSLTLTYNHPVFTQRGWVIAEDLTTEDVLYYARKELQSIRVEDAYKQSQQENPIRTFKVAGETFTISSLQNERTWANDKRVGNFRPSSDEAMQSNSDGTGIFGRNSRWGGYNLFYKGKNWLSKTYDKLFQYKQRCGNVGKEFTSLQRCYTGGGGDLSKTNSHVAFNDTGFSISSTFQSPYSLSNNQKEAHASSNLMDRGQIKFEPECDLQTLHTETDSDFGSFQDYECSPITEIRTEEVRDLPVYNLSTSTEWYVANGFIIHNCAFNPLENPYGLKDMVDAMVWAMTWLVETTQGRNTYKPVVGGYRTKLQNFKDTFKY